MEVDGLLTNSDRPSSTLHDFVAAVQHRNIVASAYLGLPSLAELRPNLASQHLEYFKNIMF
jgi:hypothetical protein